VWREFGCQTLGDYMEHYLKTDVLLLADVFENFRLFCQEKFALDPAHYVSAPHLSWDAMLRMTGVQLDLVSDKEIYDTVFKGGRGGVSVITTRYAKANNPAMGERFDPTQPLSTIIDFDKTNLYGFVMTLYLPYGGLQWVKPEELARMDEAFWLAQKLEQEVGYFAVVDLDYPRDLHDRHNDLPLAPERMNVEVDKLSEKQVDGSFLFLLICLSKTATNSAYKPDVGACSWHFVARTPWVAHRVRSWCPTCTRRRSTSSTTRPCASTWRTA